MAQGPGTKAKVRFAISVDDKMRELFAVRETNKNDLIITIKRSEEADFNSVHNELTECRFTIHPSSNTPNITVNEHVALGSDDRIYSYSHITPRRGRCLWPVSVSLCPSLRLDRYKIESRPRDKIVDVGSYDPDLGTLFYIIIVDTGRSPIVLREIPVATYIEDFRKFILIVGRGFMRLPSIHLGFSIRMANYAAQHNGKRVGNVIDRPTISPSTALLNDMIKRMMINISERHYARLVKNFKSQSDYENLDLDLLHRQAHSWGAEQVFRS